MKRSILIVTVAILAFVGGLSVRNLLSSPLDKAKVSEGSHQKLTEFSLPDLSGKPHNINEWQGKVLVINFWATWCPPCLKEMPEFEALHTEYEKKGLQFIGIALDDADPVKEFIASKLITYPILLGEDQGTKLAHDLGNIVNTVPFTVIVNKQGLVVKSHMGELTREQLLEIITPLL
ncbi:TlpA disulfide reductase family protein [Methyloglobulus sp.]|uniref:TlpA family protein disulfide reductase n=1 Tax=Methyloglobulus sp. TaxID=2518622 RepID=UPI0032B7CC3B